jgi:hypothetical protein
MDQTGPTSKRTESASQRRAGAKQMEIKTEKTNDENIVSLEGWKLGVCERKERDHRAAACNC